MNQGKGEEIKDKLADMQADVSNIEQMLGDMRADVDHIGDMVLEIQNETFRKRNKLIEYEDLFFGGGYIVDRVFFPI